MRKKIDFLERLFKLLQCRSQILEFLKDGKLIDDNQMQAILHEAHQSHPTRIASLLDELSSSDKLQLVSYEWSVLPKEVMRLTIVTDSDKKEFTYSV